MILKILAEWQPPSRCTIDIHLLKNVGFDHFNKALFSDHGISKRMAVWIRKLMMCFGISGLYNLYTMFFKNVKRQPHGYWSLLSRKLMGLSLIQTFPKTNRPVGEWACRMRLKPIVFRDIDAGCCFLLYIIHIPGTQQRCIVYISNPSTFRYWNEAMGHSPMVFQACST